MNVSNCEFKQNEATEEGGGAIWIDSKVELNVQKVSSSKTMLLMLEPYLAPAWLYLVLITVVL